mmetsp:Transcript_68443/g.107620  ORF Transcript_68443/g.107620 Transcript_68443/m.107620 type:complete len:94 (+) Transcript_68443:179-460(+)
MTGTDLERHRACDMAKRDMLGTVEKLLVERSLAGLAGSLPQPLELPALEQVEAVAVARRSLASQRDRGSLQALKEQVVMTRGSWMLERHQLCH